MADISNSHLLRTDTGIPEEDACIVLIKTEWNAAIADELERGCIAMLSRHKKITTKTITVPGAVEIPFIIQRYSEKQDAHKADAFIALGCVIKGDTPHFEYVCQTVTDGILQLNLRLPVPVIFGVLTVNNEQQAMDRIGGSHGHKGEEAAITALKMIAQNRAIK